MSRTTIATKKVTIRDVARLAGVSYGTVSRYLNGNEHVSTDAARRIAKAIEESHYTPNKAARSLAQQRTSTVAFIVQVESIATLLQASTAAAMAEANQTLGDAGYQMVTLIANSEDSTQRIAQLVQSDFADGYLLFSLSEDDSLINIFRTAHRPVVLSEASDRSTAVSYPVVDFANADGQCSITRYLLDQGKIRLAYVCGPGYSPSSSKRLHGFKQAMGAYFDDSHVYYADDWEITSGEMAAVEFQPMLHDLDGIVCANDNIAIGVINQLRRFGYRVPEDIVVTGFDDSPIATMMDPKLTTVRQDSWLHGRVMSQLLLRMLHGEVVDHQTVKLLPTEIVTRQSA